MKSLQKNKRAVRRFGKLMKFATWFQNLPNKMTPPPFRLLQIGAIFWQSRVLYVAARLDIASVIGDDTLSAETIAERVASDPDAVHRLLRMLASMGIFEQAGKQFKNNKTSAFLREDNPQCVRAMILMHNSPEMSRPWYEQLEQGVRTGEVPFKLTHGEALYDYMDTHPEFDRLFSRAMDSVEVLLGDAFATDFDWGRFGRIIDVGGSKGSKSLSILKHHPNLDALVVDRAQVIEEGKDFWDGKESPALLSRMHFQPGDVLDSVPAAQDARDIYLLSAVFHGFDDETCRRALKNLAAACGDSGASIAIMEMVLDASQPDYTGTSFDMQMFMGTRGRERTLNEWQHLFSSSGLALQEVIDLQSVAKILVLQVAER
ncbi:MAG: methyltransferase [Gammaproteobacteria bacterium]